MKKPKLQPKRKRNIRKQRPNPAAGMKLERPNLDGSMLRAFGHLFLAMAEFATPKQAPAEESPNYPADVAELEKLYSASESTDPKPTGEPKQ